MGRWSRKEKPTVYEHHILEVVLPNVSGMTRYGNRARCSVMLPPLLAEEIANRAKEQNKTVSEVIVKLLESKIKL